jgi:hypothetical protein
MSTASKEETVDSKDTTNIAVRMVPEGTFAGTREKPMLVKDGEPVPENTGDEGAGQN